MSGPSQRERLSLPQLLAFLEDSRDSGYEVAALSGGEPLLFEDLPSVLDAADALGLRKTVVTNGTLLTRDSSIEVMKRFDFVAVSLDGLEELHNKIRQSPTAFSRLLEGMAVLVNEGVHFGILHSVTRASLPHLPSIAALAVAKGASLLQLHPLAMVGAAGSMNGWALDGESLARTYITALALRAQYSRKLKITVDLFNREQLRTNLDAIIPPARAPAGALLSDLVNPLVLMANGDVSPICHALHPRLRLGNIGTARLHELAGRFVEEGLLSLRTHAQAVWADVESERDAWPYLNWYERLEMESNSA